MKDPLIIWKVSNESFEIYFETKKLAEDFIALVAVTPVTRLRLMPVSLHREIRVNPLSDKEKQRVKRIIA